MPWISRHDSVSSMTSEFSNVPDNSVYRQKYRNERVERKNQTMALKELQSEFSEQSKQLSEARQTIDQLRLGATINLYGAPPQPGEKLEGTLGNIGNRNDFE